MSTDEAVEVLCDLCGSTCTGVDGGRDWTHLEVTRERPVEGTHWLSADFCTQAHAAEWLGRPLPDPVPPGEAAATTWADRMWGAVGVAVCLGVIGLFVLGVWTALRFVIGLF